VTPSVSYGYDADGRRASMRDGSGSSSYTYDPLGRLTNVTDGHGSTTTFGYDLADNQTSVTYPNGKTVTRTFDAAGRTSSISDWLRDKTGYGYDADSELTQISPPKNTDSYSYNNAGQITDIAIAAGKGLVASLTYTRDNNGQITSETPSGLPGGAQSYAYNKLNQLTQAGPNGYSYDQADNPTTFAGASGYTYDAANELTQSPTASYTYNALGQRTGVIPASGPATSYGYDQAGNLTSASTGGTTTSYGYDGNGIRVSQSSGGTSTNYAWDLSGKLPTLLSDGNNSYVYNPDGTPLEAIDSSGNVTYYHHDQLGSTRVLTSATGAATNTYSYDPYGTLSGSTGTGAPSLGFAGQYTDSGSGLQYLRARYYDPGTGGFLTRDPLEQLTQQPYSYAQDNPTNGLDPTGLCGFGSIGDFFDCVNPASSGNVAYQGAQAFSNATGIDVTGALGSATNAIVENARPIAEATATVLACATPYVDVVSCPEVILGTAALNVGVNDVNEYNAVNQGCSASPYIRSDLFELTIAGMGLSVAKTLSVANASLDSYASSQSTSARRALNYLNGLATGSGLGATAAHQAQPTGCGCGP
jgi:RHS repeat-associated protein